MLCWRMHNHERLDVWHIAVALSVTICRATSRTRVRRHRFLLNQLERSITSVPANIAEGCGQSTDPKAAQHVGIAIGSVMESLNHLKQIAELGLLPGENIAAWREELWRIRRMSESFQRRLLNELPDPEAPIARPKSRSSVQSPRSRSKSSVPRRES